MSSMLKTMLNLMTEPTVCFRKGPLSIPPRRATDRRHGFTLLEVMVSLAIIAIALLAIYGNFSRTLSMNIEQKFNAMAPLLAAQVIADFESRPADEMTDDSGDFGVKFDGYTWKASVESVETQTLGSIADDLRTIDVIVSFGEDQRAFECKTLRFLRREAENQ